jgi:hypothetical protein
VAVCEAAPCVGLHSSRIALSSVVVKLRARSLLPKLELEALRASPPSKRNLQPCCVSCLASSSSTSFCVAQGKAMSTSVSISHGFALQTQCRVQGRF